MNIISELSEPVELMEFGPYYKLMFQEKLSRGKEMIDLRVWKKWNTDQVMHPGKNGLMIEKDKFKIALERINTFMTANVDKAA